MTFASKGKGAFMNRSGRAGVAVTAAHEKTTARRGRSRLPVRVTTALAAVLLGAGLAAAFAPAVSAAPPPAPPPAPGVGPAAVATSGTARYVFYTAGDGSVWWKTVGSSAPAVPAGSTGRLLDSPSVIWGGGSTLYVFGRGQGDNDALWNTTCDTTTGTCGPWLSMGGIITSKPGAANINSTYYSVYVRDQYGQVAGRSHGPSGWGAWFTIGGQVLTGTGPAAVGRDTDTYVLVTGTNGQLYINKNGVGGFTLAAGLTTSSSPALINIPDALIGYARGSTDNAGWYHEFLSTTPEWHSLGGTLTSGMGGASWGATEYGYGLGSDSQVIQNTGLTFGVWPPVTP